MSTSPQRQWALQVRNLLLDSMHDQFWVLLLRHAGLGTEAIMIIEALIATKQLRAEGDAESG